MSYRTLNSLTFLRFEYIHIFYTTFKLLFITYRYKDSHWFVSYPCKENTNRVFAKLPSIHSPLSKVSFTSYILKFTDTPKNKIRNTRGNLHKIYIRLTHKSKNTNEARCTTLNIFHLRHYDPVTYLPAYKHIFFKNIFKPLCF